MTEQFAKRIDRLSESQRRKLHVELRVLAKDTHAQLYAYVESNNGVSIDIEDIRLRVAAALPKHMQPNSYVEVESIPKLPNGKIDRKKLPFTKRVIRESARSSDEDNPLAEPESMTDGLAELWSKTLRAEYVLPDDDFFELGGHSLLGVQLLLDVKERFGVEIPLPDLFDAPLLRDMNDRIMQQKSSSGVVSTIQSGGGETPIFTVHGGATTLPDAFGPERPLYLVFDSISTTSADMSSVEKIAEHYLQGIRAIQPQGPYLLCGYSFGGLVAYEMACRLSDLGEEVPLVALVESVPPGVSDHLLRLRLHSLFLSIQNSEGLRAKIHTFWRALSKLFSKLSFFRTPTVAIKADSHEEILAANAALYWEIGNVYKHPKSRFECAIYVPQYSTRWLKFLRRQWQSVVHGKLHFSYIDGAKCHADMARPPFDVTHTNLYADLVRSVEQQSGAKKDH